VLDRIDREVLRPTLAELERRGAPFRGVLFAGVMMHPDGTPNVVEFNCRLGDPETEVVLPLVRRGLAATLLAAACGEALPAMEFHDAVAVTTVLASAGYPDAPRRGDTIVIPDNMPDGVVVYHAGTACNVNGELTTSGGRVLAVTAVAQTFETAAKRSRDAAGAIAFEGKQFRSDIGWRETRRGAPAPAPD